MKKQLQILVQFLFVFTLSFLVCSNMNTTVNAEEIVELEEKEIEEERDIHLAFFSEKVELKSTGSGGKMVAKSLSLLTSIDGSFGIFQKIKKQDSITPVSTSGIATKLYYRYCSIVVYA